MFNFFSLFQTAIKDTHHDVHGPNLSHVGQVCHSEHVDSKHKNEVLTAHGNQNSRINQSLYTSITEKAKRRICFDVLSGGVT